MLDNRVTDGLLKKTIDNLQKCLLLLLLFISQCNKNRNLWDAVVAPPAGGAIEPPEPRKPQKKNKEEGRHRGVQERAFNFLFYFMKFK